MKNGADISQEVEDYPDLTPLYMSLPRALGTTSTALDLALRIACSYALPRTVIFLLASGANANTFNPYGIAAIHTVVMRRQPWRELPIIDRVLIGDHRPGKSRWESILLRTVSALLDFGADVHLRSQISRLHKCGTSCWCSIDCDHQSHTALHFASANGIPAVVLRLLDAGSDLNMPNAQGYTALYCALVQGHKDAAYCILQRSTDAINPVVNQIEHSTALHVACRFSFTDVVYELLQCGAYANVPNSHGRTPLHEVLTWFCPDREEKSLITLKCLTEFGADPNNTAYRLTPRQIAETHPSKPVRDMFLKARKRTQVRCERPFSSSGTTRSPSNGSGRSEAKRNITPPQALPGPVPRDVHSELVDSVWEPPKIMQLVKSFEAGSKTFDSQYTVAEREPFPNLVSKTEPSGTPVHDLWSGAGTAQMIRGLEVRTLPAKSTQPQRPLHSYPVLRKPTESDMRPATLETLHDEASKFWGVLDKQRAGAFSKPIKEGNESTAVPNANSSKTKRRWKPIKL